MIEMKNRETDKVHDSLIKVLLAEDHGAFRKSLKLLIAADSHMEVVGDARNGREAVRLSKSLRPDVIVMDIAMPVMNGLRATQEIMETSPNARILMLSAHPEAEYIKEALVCGASGYLIKQSSTHVLARAVRQIFGGNSYFEEPIAQSLREECRKLFGKSEQRKKRNAQAAMIAASG
jgi:DNA-binding NarL/FixJ family response regulator